MKISKFSAAILAAALTLSAVSCGNTVQQAETSENEIAESSQTAVSVSKEEIPVEETSANSETTEEIPEKQASSETSETSSKEKMENKSVSQKLRGNIYDCDGHLLVSTDEISKRRVYAKDYAVSFANIITEMSEGYDLTFNDRLTAVNPTPVNDSDSIGQSIQLTIDGDMQNAVYAYLQSNNIIGSVVILRSDGSLCSQVSYPSYDPNDVAVQEYDENLAWGEYGNKAFQNYEPGSCFKIMSEVIADKHGIYSQYDDGTWEVGGVPIVNWDHETNKSYPIADRSLYSGFVNSSNIFFAKTFDQIGAEDVLSDLSTIFHFGIDDDIICDFGYIHNNIEIYCDDDLRRSAFGQSYVLTCPIYLAALGREAVFGDMVTPFVLKNSVDSVNPDKVTESGSEALDVIASIPEEYRENLKNGMLGVASGLGISLPSGYTLYAKTGTAETWVNDFLYITGCVKKDGDDGKKIYSDYSDYKDSGSYIVVMQIQNPADHGFEFASHSARYYQGLVNTVLENS